MELLNQWGIAFILWVQSVNPALDSFFKTVNFLQTEDWFLIVLPFVWWCIDKRLGASLTLIFLSSEFFVRLLKGITGVTRPYDLEPRIRNLDPQTDLSFPSAGAMDTLVFWGYLATQFKKRTFWVLAVAMIVLLSFTRVYLGVHYPADVVGSILIGIVIIAAFIGFRIAERVASLPKMHLWIMAIVYPIGLATIRLNPETAVSLGAMLGFNIGLLLESQYVQFEPRTAAWKQVVKLVVGFAFVLGLRIAIKAMLPADDVFTFARYAIIGLWMGAGAPWLFVVARLAKGGTRGLVPEPTKAFS